MNRITSLLLWTAAAAMAQPDWNAVTALKPGQRVMVSYAKSFAEGPLVSADAERVLVKTAAGEVNAARVDVKKLWVPANKRGRNAAIGALIGFGAALAPAWLVGTWLDNHGGNGGAAALSTVAIGAGAGAGIGSLNRGRTLVYRR